MSASKTGLRSQLKRAILGHYVYLNITSRKGGFRHRRVSALIRDRWLAHGLQTGFSDRAAAEAAVRELYRLINHPAPTFRWVPSPAAAAQIIRTDRLSTAMPARQLDHAPARIAHLVVSSRHRYEDQLDLRDTAIERSRALRASQLRDSVARPLRTSLINGVAAAIRTLMPPSVGLLTWYGQHEAHHLAYHESLVAAGLAHPTARDRTIHGIQTELAHATGWWWPFDEVCLMSERPTVLCAQPFPNGGHNEHHLHHDDRPALEFADGAVVYAVHGTTVPSWVVHEPTAERIASEPDVDIRRCAIDRLGWPDYRRAAGLRLIDEAAGPDGPPLQLFAAAAGGHGVGNLLVSAESSSKSVGAQRYSFLRVPRRLTSALDAAAWTVGLSAADYARTSRLGCLAVIPISAGVGEVSVPRSASLVRVGADGILLSSGSGANVPYALTCPSGVAKWTTNVVDRSGLAHGVLQTEVPARLSHPEFGSIVVAPGRYVIRRRREG